MSHRGGVTTKYAVKAVRVLFEKAQNGGKTHYQDCDVTTEKEADKRLVRLDLPKREVRLWTSGSPCMRACDLHWQAKGLHILTSAPRGPQQQPWQTV